MPPVSISFAVAAAVTALVSTLCDPAAETQRRWPAFARQMQAEWDKARREKAPEIAKHQQLSGGNVVPTVAPVRE